MSIPKMMSTRTPHGDESSEDKPATITPNKQQIFTKCSIIKNLVVVAVGTFLLLGSEDILLMYQSTMNSEEGMGVYSIAVQYAFAVLSSLFLPKYLILRFGCKAVMALSIVTYAPFYLVNYRPMMSLMILTSAVLGVGCSLFKGSVDLYINDIASAYAKLKNRTSNSFSEIQPVVECKPIPTESDAQTSYDKQLSNHRINELQIEKKPIKYIKLSDDFNHTSVNQTFKTPNSNIENFNLNLVNKYTINSSSGVHPNKTDITSSVDLYTIKFFGFHSMIYQTCYIWSNLLSFYIFQTDNSRNQTSGIYNSTCSCGATYCNADDDVCSIQNLQQPTSKTRNYLLSMCIALCLLAVVLVVVFLDKFRQKDKSVKVSLRILLATLHQMKRKEQILLVPMIMNNGIMKGFFLADFTKSYIGCAWGIRQIGLVAAFSGGAMAFFSLMSGWFVRRLGRRLVFTAAGLVNLVLNATFLVWSPDPSRPVVFFAAAGMWGAVFGTFHTQVRAYHGVLFKNDTEAAFAAYQLWYCIGSCLCLAFSNFLCNTIKIYILMFFALLGTIGYWMIELLDSQVKTIMETETHQTKSVETTNGLSYRN